MVRAFTPPEIVQVPRALFLAGPIQGAADWQAQAVEIIHGLDPEVLIASPRKEYAPGTFVYERQVDWETHMLRTAGARGVIAFWLAKQAVETPGRAYAQTTRFELAEWKVRHEVAGAQLALGIEAGFGNERYIRRRFEQDCPDIAVQSTLPDLCQQAVELYRQA